MPVKSWFIIERPINALKVFFAYVAGDVRAKIEGGGAVEVGNTSRLSPAMPTNS
jgi:hypothetical protein